MYPTQQTFQFMQGQFYDYQSANHNCFQSKENHICITMALDISEEPILVQNAMKSSWNWFFFLIWVVHVIMSIVLRGCAAFSDLYIFLCRWSCYSSLHTSVWWVQVLPKSKDKSLQHNSVSELKMVTIGLLATEFLFSFKWKAHYLWTDFVNRDKQSIAKCALLSTN